MERYACLNKDHENCNRTVTKKHLFHHENIAYKKKRSYLNEH